jgi:tRNA A-37 threonylcarbamoyl transferase component Bud32
MTGCPSDSALRRLGADLLPAAAARSLERHLDGCERCRTRLDALTDVTAVGAALGAARPGPAGLSRILDRLRGGGTEVASPAAWSLPPSDRPGFIGRLGAIEVRREIGRGGMGVVYEGLDLTLYRPVAVKVLSPHLLGDAAARERFLREARAAAALTHEHVVTIHAVDQHAGVPYLLLQYVAGESLAERLTREVKLPVADVARIGGQIARGLAAAHARGLIHRDVKPANVLLDAETGAVRLTDFGLAKVVGGETITGVGVVAGTPAYMSPEQAAGEPVDARSDLFSLGVVLYAAATGKPPFDGDSPHAVLFQIREATPRPLAEADPTLPAWFCAIVDRLLEKEPARRIQTAAETADQLERRPIAPSRRRFGRLGAAAVLALGLAAAIALAPANRDAPPAIEQPAPEPGAAVPPGFVVVGTGNHYPSLWAAAKAAADGDTIEVHGDGPHLERRLDVRGKGLTIRAAAGSRPRIRPARTGKFVEAHWIHTDSDLTLEGLEVHWPAPAERPALDALFSHAVVHATGGRLTVRRCQVVCGKPAVCVVAGGARVEIEDSHFVADDGVGVWWRAPAGGSMTVTRSVFEGTAAVFHSFGAGDAKKADPIAVSLTDNTLAVKGVWSFVYPAIPKQTVRFDARRNLVSATYLFGVPTRAPTAADATAALRGLVVWSEADNVYDRKGNFLTAVRANPWMVFPSELKTLADWNRFWKSAATESVEADVRFRPRPPAAGYSPPNLERIDNASGPVPARVGASDSP